MLCLNAWANGSFHWTLCSIMLTKAQRVYIGAAETSSARECLLQVTPGGSSTARGVELAGGMQYILLLQLGLAPALLAPGRPLLQVLGQAPLTGDTLPPDMRAAGQDSPVLLRLCASVWDASMQAPESDVEEWCCPKSTCMQQEVWR